MMAWADLFASSDASTAKSFDLPLFPLNTVLFPGAILPLRLFEQRYLDMAAQCLRENTPFGIALIDAGQETGQAAKPHAVGTLAEIIQCDMEQLGILNIRVCGGQRFRIMDHHVGPQQALHGHVRLIPHHFGQAIPAAQQRLLPLLQRILKELGPERAPEPHFPEDAEWVGYRISEILPVPHLAKQKLLELEDPVMRLEVIERYLEQRQLLD